ncbi:bifunctional enoyl-CoA hydratase/phosphate acetyltransferase [bacterium]|nr:bifunctional enoyl-CoA hydratase/phosphate acetyltransferase [bacterium]
MAGFILIVSMKEIENICKDNNIKLSFEIVDEPDHKKAAEKAVELVKAGQASALMKGLLHTGTFLKAVLDKEKGLNRGKQITQASVFEKEYGDGFQILSDCAISIQPDVNQKIQIVENTIELSKKLGYGQPRIALLSALETVNPAINDTIEAAVISKMADRGQIKGAIIDGPLALDNAISEESAHHKGIYNEVVGKADVLLAPDIDTGNILGKSILYYGNTPTGGMIIGAKVPVIMLSRSDTIDVRLNSIKIALAAGK